MKEKTETIAGINNASLGLKGRWLIFFSIFIGLGVTIYEKPLYALGAAVLHRYGSSHGLFVSFISAYLVGLKLDKIGGNDPGSRPTARHLAPVHLLALFSHNKPT